MKEVGIDDLLEDSTIDRMHITTVTGRMARSTKNNKTTRYDEALRAYTMRCQRYTIQEIADELEVSRHTAERRIEDGRLLVPLEDVEEARTKDLHFIDQALAALMPALLRGDARAHGSARGWLNRRAALLGLDAPKVLDVNHSGEVAVTTPIDQEIRELSALLGIPLDQV